MNQRQAPGLLTPAEYQLLAAPCLEAAAQVAAERGDPQLYNDMASMLGLLGAVTCLTHVYLQQSQPGASPRGQLEAAPLAICALVFTESNLDAAEVERCLQALAGAYLKLLKEGVFGPQEALVEQAYVELMEAKRPAALQNLKRGILAMALAVDAWEAVHSATGEP